MMRAGIKKAIICLAAGPEQYPVIKKAKEMGLEVIAVDRNPKAVGFELADEKIVLSTYEAKPIINRIRKLKKYELMGVINRSSGPPVVTAARISKALGLPGLEPDIAETAISKSKLNKICRERNICVPICQSVRSLTELDWDKIKYPSIIKPSLSLVGKSGVLIVEDPDDLKEAFQNAREVSYDGWVNIEEHVAGQDICLMAVVYERQLMPLVLLDELNQINEQGEVSGAGFAVPSIFTGTIEEKRILKLAEDIINKLQFKTTPFLMCCRCRKGDFPRLIELHLDFGGDLVLDELLPESTDFDFIKYVINILTDNPLPLPKISFQTAAILYGEGDGFFHGRRFRIIKDDNRTKLENILREICVT
jgi:carbamoylphosphate synthase large subunit